MLSRRTLCLSLALAPLTSLAAPNNMSIIVPYPPGGPLDNVARLLGAALQPVWGKTVIENIAGGAGARGMLAAKKAKNDGKTLVMGAVATLAVNPQTVKNLPYSVNDFAPVAMLSNVPNVLVMTPKTMEKLNIKSAKDLLNYLKKTPDKLNCASGGTGSIGHLANAILSANGFIAAHVPYAGASPAQLSLFSGETDFLFDNYASCQQAIKDGRLKALAVTTAQSSKLLSCPTMRELGVPMNLSTWFGLLAPKGTSPDTCLALYNALEAVVKEPEVLQKLLIATPFVSLMGPQAFADFIKNEQQKYQQLFSTLKLI